MSFNIQSNKYKQIKIEFKMSFNIQSNKDKQIKIVNI
jgi:hypothetical protein